MSDSNSLSAANQRWHKILDDDYQHFLEALTALNFSTASQQWQQFKLSLSTHIEFEHSHIEPLAEPWEMNIHKLIQSDHLILERLMPKLDQALALIEQATNQRAELVRSLDGFIKMRNVLIHHDLREMEHLYPQLEQQLSTLKASTLASSMDKARLLLSA